MKQGVPALPADIFSLGVFMVLGATPKDPATFSAEETLAVAGETLFPRAPELARAFAARFVATLAVVDHGDFAAWVRHGSTDVMHLHPALLAAAAGARVNRNGRFARRRLAERAAALAADEFVDWTWPDSADHGR